MEHDKEFDKESAFRTLELINSWTNNADSKASFALAFATAILALMFYNAGSLPQAFSSFLNACSLGIMTWKKFLPAAILALMYLSFMGSILKFFASLKGNVKINGEKKSLFFFGAIATFSCDEYKEKILNVNNEDMEQDLCEQIYINSVICTKKFETYNCGLRLLTLATVLCVLSLLLGFM